MQHIILLVIILLAAGLVYIPPQWPGGLHMTFSQHVAAHRWARLYYALLFLITLPLLLWFFVGWLVPERALPSAFIWFAASAVVFQIACTFVPETGGTRTTVHKILAGISGISMLPMVVIFATEPQLSLFARLIACGALMLMMSLLVVGLLHQKGYSKALLLQIGYYASFFAATLVVTYAV